MLGTRAFDAALALAACDNAGSGGGTSGHLLLALSDELVEDLTVHLGKNGVQLGGINGDAGGLEDGLNVSLGGGVAREVGKGVGGEVLGRHSRIL